MVEDGLGEGVFGGVKELLFLEQFVIAGLAGHVAFVGDLDGFLIRGDGAGLFGAFVGQFEP